MRIMNTCIVYLALTLSATAQAPKVEESPAVAPPVWEVKKGAVGRATRLVTLEANVRWTLAEEGTDAELVVADGGKTAVLLPIKPGRYKVLCAGGNNDVTRVVVVVEGVTPIPPNPPAPTPPGPAPVPSVFRDLIQVELDKDKASAADKAEGIKDLIELYSQAQKLANDEKVTTVETLAEKLRAASAVLLGTNVLMTLRQKIAEEIGASFPNPGALSATSRATAVTLFARIEVALKELKVK